MTNNDILAEYVRKNYPKIEKSFDFTLYRMIKRFTLIGEILKKIGGNYEENKISISGSDDGGCDSADVGTGEDCDKVRDQDNRVEGQGEWEDGSQGQSENKTDRDKDR